MFGEQLRAQGLSYDADFIEAFFLSLRTKPFVILSGISGTGKTGLAKAIMRLVGNEDARAIAVAPDWTDNTDMLGYFGIDDRFQTGEFTELVKRAAKRPHVPYFVILDEMNLARVEYYFAQVLSVMESRIFRPELNRVEYRDYLFNSAMRARLELAADPEVAGLANLKLVPNVYIIGTVNIDETTHPFSKKVLDRANVLEINKVNLLDGIGADDGDVSLLCLAVPNRVFSGTITNLRELQANWSQNRALNLQVTDTLTKWIGVLIEFSNLLAPLHMSLGFRVRDEVCIYLYHAACINATAMATDNWWHKYFDQQLVQKVLTRFGGEQGQIEDFVVKLFELCMMPQDALQLLSRPDVITMSIPGSQTESEEAGIRFPKAARKLQSMLKDIDEYGKSSTSFWMV